MASSLGAHPSAAAPHGPVAEGLTALFRRVAIFRLDGTRAILERAVGMAPRPGLEISLVDRTPLRSAIEAASPVIGSGRESGGLSLARSLEISPARTFAVVPLVENRRVVGLAYADRIDEPLSLSQTAELFRFCAEQLGARRPGSPKGLRSTRRARRSRPLRADRARRLPGRALPPPPPREALEGQEPSEAEPGPAPKIEPATAPLPEWADHTERIPRTFSADRDGWGHPEPTDADLHPNGESWTLAQATAEALPEWSESEGAKSATVLPPPRALFVASDGSQETLPEGLAPFRRRRAVALLLSTALALLFALPSVALLTLAPPRSGEGETVVRIPEGASFRAIARRLREASVIRNELAFKLVAQATSIDRTLKAGTYRLPQNAYGWEIAAELARGQVNLRELTVPEGLSLEQVAALVAGSGLTSHYAFLEATRDPALLRRLGIPGRSAEGFLYPETYRLAIGLSAHDIVSLMVEQFREVQAELGVEREGDALREWVTLASLVQREARSPVERTLVAGVFSNRLRRDMRLESCATVQYILGEPKAKLTLEDVRIPHHYNTYVHPGLPPGPIASPGRDALAAAARPAAHDYLFFVAREDGTGRHVFSETYREHLAAKARIEQRAR